MIGWAGLRNRQQMLHESYALAAVESLIARAEEHLKRGRTPKDGAGTQGPSAESR